MKTVTKIYLIVLSLLLATIVGLCFAWQYAKDEAKDAKHSLAIAEANAVIQQERETRYLSELNEEYAKNISAMTIEITKAESEYKVELNEIKSLYTAATLDNKRLLDKVRLLNSELSNLTRASVEDYAQTAGNNLAECSATTTELERIAYEYNSELEYYRSIWTAALNKQQQSGIVVFDEASGLKNTYYTPIKLKADVEDLEVVTP